MKIIILIIIIAVFFWIKSLVFKKIDRNEAIALATPGRANFIRDNYVSVIDYVLSMHNSSIQFERTDQIKFSLGNDREYLVINSYSGGLLIAHVKWSAVQKEWKFSRNEIPQHIIYELNKYFN